MIQRYLAAVILLLLSSFLAAPAMAGDKPVGDMDTCLMQKLKFGDDSLTLGEARAQCRRELATVRDLKDGKQPAPGKIVEARTQIDQSNVLKPFTLMAHKPNYFLFYAYNAAGYNPDLYRKQYGDDDIDLDNDEVQFQISIKTPLGLDLFDSGVGIWAAYTNRSFWQFYNDDLSSPFRETNHEPEVWAQFRSDFKFLGFETAMYRLGIVHQSNGKGGVLSRSWNRVYADFLMERGDLVISFKPWVRIPEDDADDDNSDIIDYLGNYELRAAYEYADNCFSLMLRNNLQSGFQRGAVEAGWSFPLGSYKYLKGYVQYFGGYGESLIDYDNYVNRIGVGIILTDWL